MAFSPSTMRSRRRLNSATISFAASCGPSIASTAAICVKAAVHDTLLVARREMGSTSSTGMTPNPMRHPVIAYVLEKPSRMIVRSRMPGNVLMLWCSPSYRYRLYISSDSTTMSCSTANSASDSSVALSTMLPQGLLGELTIISLVLGVICEATSSRSMSNSLSTESRIGTGVPPAKSIIDS